MASLGCHEPTPDPNANPIGPQDEITPPPAEPLWGATNLRQTRTGIQSAPKMKSQRLLHCLFGVPRTYAKPEWESNVFGCLCVCVCGCVYVCMCVCVYRIPHLGCIMCMLICMCTCIGICVYGHMCMCVCVCKRVYVYMYVD